MGPTSTDPLLVIVFLHVILLSIVYNVLCKRRCWTEELNKKSQQCQGNAIKLALAEWRESDCDIPVEKTDGKRRLITPNKCTCLGRNKFRTTVFNSKHYNVQSGPIDLVNPYPVNIP